MSFNAYWRRTMRGSSFQSVPQDKKPQLAHALLPEPLDSSFQMFDESQEYHINQCEDANVP